MNILDKAYKGGGRSKSQKNDDVFYERSPFGL